MKKKSGKGFSVVTVIFSIATILICTLIATLGVLDIAEVMPMYSTYYHKYTYRFFDSENRLFTKITLIKGEEFNEVIPEQYKEDDYSDSEIKSEKIDDETFVEYFFRTFNSYSFTGWDINGDYSPDAIPKKAYFNIDAYPTYRVTSRTEKIYV